MLGNEAKVLLQKPRKKPRQEIMKVLFINFKLPEVKDEHCNCTRHTSNAMHPKITLHPHSEPNEPTNIPSGKMELASACSTY